MILSIFDAAAEFPDRTACVHLGHSITFRELRARCEDVSPTLLNTRLKELRSLNLVEQDTGGHGFAHGRQQAHVRGPLFDGLGVVGQQ